MRSDPDGSNESDSASEPDEFDSLVLDDNFVAAGIPEASLAPHERALPAIMRPRPPKKHVPDEPEHPMRQWAQSGFGGRGRMRSVGFLLIVATVLMTSVVLTGLLHIAPLSAAAIGAGAPLPAATQFASASDTFPARVTGLTRSTPLGACFDVAATSAVPAATAASCASPHQYELVGFELVTGRSDQYPAASYWAATVDAQCAVDLSWYLGRTADQWPPTVQVHSFTPSPATWAQGDRIVYCAADRQPSASGSVRYTGPVTTTHTA